MKDKETWMAVGCLGLIFVIILAVLLGVNWYKAGVQSQVWQREGIELSTWEVFMGAKPAERTINVK